jgi:hypothetical protein
MQQRHGRIHYERRWTNLTAERSSWITHWQELGDHLMPRSARFFKTDRNKGTRKHQNIFDSTATRALNVLAAGMMAGMTSPARPWFRLAIEDRDLMEYASVKTWLSETQRRMLHIFATSNTYMMLHSVYEDLGCFGTSCAIGMDDFDNLIHHYNAPIGEYCLATDFKGRVNTVYREFEKTVGELVGEFGLNSLSPTVRNMYSNGNYDAWIPVMHVVEPRLDRDVRKKDGYNKRWKSCYFEQGREDAGERMLREGGFDDFPALAPRWRRSGGDVYGSSPGMEALGDIKQLQHEQLRKANGIDYMTKPPLQVPTSMKGREVDFLPGGITYADQIGQNAGIRSMWEVRLDLNHLLEDIRDVRERINSCFNADMFLMLSGGDMTRMTATEVAERHEEKLLMLGPVLERLHNELLKPLIDNTFTKMVAAGAVPPPPPELEGMDLNIEFVSMLAQAQRAVATNSIDRFVMNLGAIAQMKPEVLDKFNADEWADAYSDMLGVDPELIVSSEQVTMVRQSRAEQAQKEEMMAQAQMEADAAAKLGTVKTGERNAAADLIGQFSGYNSPSPLDVAAS